MPRIVEDYQNQSIYLVIGDTVNLEQLKEETKPYLDSDMSEPVFNNKPTYGWNIVIKSAQNENELNDFIKENYGSKCMIRNRKISQQEDIYELELNNYEDPNGNPTDLGSATCPVNFAYTILYYPKINKVISVKLGQECTFSSDTRGTDCYDQQIIDSIRIN